MFRRPWVRSGMDMRSIRCPNPNLREDGTRNGDYRHLRRISTSSIPTTKSNFFMTVENGCMQNIGPPHSEDVNIQMQSQLTVSCDQF